MKLTTRGRYGARALLDMALYHDGRPIPLRDIAVRQAIPVQYLEQLVSPLIKAGIVRSTRGPGGGVALARPPQQIRLSEVIEVLEGSIVAARLCATRDVWEEVGKAVFHVLESTTVQDMVTRHREKEQTEAAMHDV
ncbi:MAG: Rrf2 family transcriptional regulator [Chloroflexi bacterium]|nr:Rrf2 family transcriptional regulator [Chloroflexota bacterium]